MRLKRLELSGFKSFVDSTRIDLGHGITAVVGPNGSGKSNVVDAIRWVLGEHSARHLRGGVMDDLIFQGSDSRASVAVCDVELTFSVSKGQLAPPYHELDEISVRRRLMREGVSDAFINGKPVRIKDIVDIFLDTGISTRAYAIVEQGSIARMITAKPEERRLLLEEAAGVMKYRARRRETEHKMNSTRQNLERVSDLLEEVRSQCRSLRQQASRAERFKAMQSEYEQLQKQNMGLRYQQRQAQLSEQEKQLQQTESLLQQAYAEHSTHEKKVADARMAMQQHDEHVQQAQEALRQVEQQRASLQQQAERLAGEQRLLKERLQSLQQRMQETQARQKLIDEETQMIQSQLSSKNDVELKTQQQQLQHVFEQAQQQLQQARQKRDVLLAEFERLRGAMQNVEKRRQQAADMLVRLQQRQQKVESELHDVNGQLSQHQHSITQGNIQLEDASLVVQQQEMALQQAEQQLDTARSQHKQILQQRDDSEQQWRAARGSVEELRAKLAQQQGLSSALRDDLREQGGVWIDESLDVPEGLEAAVAAALRGHEADIYLPQVMQGQHLTPALLEMLEKTPIAVYLGTDARHSEALSLAQALDLADSQPLYALFSDVVLYDDALSLQRPSQGCAVSRDGWRLDADGWLLPPAKQQTARRLQMKRTLKKAEQHLQQTEKQWQQAEQDMQQAEQGLQQMQQHVQQQQVQLSEAKSGLQTVQAQLTQWQHTQQSVQARQQHLQHEAEAIATDMVHWQQQQRHVGDVDMQRLKQAEAELQRQEDVVQAHDEQLQHKRAALTQAEQALALHQQAVQGLQREQARLQQEQQHMQQRQQHDTQLHEQTQQKLAEFANHQQLDTQLGDVIVKVEAAHQALNALHAKGQACMQQLHIAEREERESRRVIEQRQQARQQAELQCVSERTRLQDLAQDIQEKFNVAPDALYDGEPLDDKQTKQLLQHMQQLEMRLSQFGPVNLLAIEEFEQASEREGFLSAQAADLESSMQTLSETIRRIDKTTRQRFMDVFEQTNAYFMQTFPRLFGGGRAELRLDSEDVLTAGVEVIAQPPGKRLQDVTLLSGGEKALTAVALVFSIFRIKPAPFCILDEVDAPLDDANVERFVDMISELAGEVQFLAITHNKITMQKADRLIGVSMPEPGVSKIVGVDIGAMTV